MVLYLLNTIIIIPIITMNKDAGSKYCRWCSLKTLMCLALLVDLGINNLYGFSKNILIQTLFENIDVPCPTCRSRQKHPFRFPKIFWCTPSLKTLMGLALLVDLGKNNLLGFSKNISVHTHRQKGKPTARWQLSMLNCVEFVLDEEIILYVKVPERWLLDSD